MKQFKLNITTHYQPEAGRVLIAEPFLEDPNFVRAVIFICEHDEEGTFGLVLNKPIQETLGELVPALQGINLPVYAGGPVEEHTLHVLHSLPNELGGTKIGDKIYFGTDLISLQTYLMGQNFDSTKVKFFVGYSGWSNGQLAEEIKEESWLVAPTTNQVIFSQNTEEFYKESLALLGDEYKYYFMLPTSPNLN